MFKSNQCKIERPIFFSIPILFILSAPLHFLFDFTGRIPAIGVFVPVNESTWEHLKLVFFPLLIWWIVYYFKERKCKDFSKEKWIVSAAASMLSAILTIIVFFYSYTGAFGVHFLFLDILSILLSLIVGQYFALHIYKYYNPSIFIYYLSIDVIIILLFMFIFFTFSPSKLPLFWDRKFNGYGIPKK